MSSLLENLNPEQRAAVTLPAEHALVLAGAGSGKTRVLTTRIAWLIAQGAARPAEILAVTFTNKAAKEMSARLAALLPFDVRGMWIGTFHGLSNRLLRTHHQEAGLPQTFQILDSADQLAAVKRLLKALNVDEERFPPRELAQFINASKEQGLRPEAIEAWDESTRRRVELLVEYERQCQREGVVDFAELLLRAHELLSRNEPLLHHYQQRFRHVLVDEFQDSNPLQYRWLKRFAGGGAALFAVGDDDQSIYGFRGAEVANLRTFEREFDVRHLIRLEQNYRSFGNILDAANALIRNNSQRLGKNLWTERGGGEPLRLYAAGNDSEEARFIADETRMLLRQGHRPGEIAVLYRANAQSRVVEHALFGAGIAYRVYGGLRFFERQEVKHALAYLRLVANRHDDTAFARVVNFPVRGIGSRTLEQLQELARSHDESLWAASARLSGRSGQSLTAFTRLVDAMAEGCVGLRLAELIEQVLKHSGLRAHYQSERDAQDRVANLEELVHAAGQFEAEHAGAVTLDSAPPALGGDADGGQRVEPLIEFLTYAALESGEHQAGAGQEAIQLMTVHAAKGLEFDAVFLTGLEEGLFPHENSIEQDRGLEEERRLMYVAVTRARKRLYLTLSEARMLHGQTRYRLPSRFIEEIPPALIQRQSVAPAAARGTSPMSMAHRPAAAVRAATPGRAAGAREAELAHGLRIGQSVHHARFGPGVILGAEGRGTDARVQVQFTQAGVKWLALSVAKLTPA